MNTEFAAFCGGLALHMHFAAPAKGNEKGGVEGLHGYIEDLANAHLEKQISGDREGDRLEIERLALRPLPAIAPTTAFVTRRASISLPKSRIRRTDIRFPRDTPIATRSSKYFTIASVSLSTACSSLNSPDFWEKRGDPGSGSLRGTALIQAPSGCLCGGLPPSPVPPIAALAAQQLC